MLYNLFVCVCVYRHTHTLTCYLVTMNIIRIIYIIFIQHILYSNRIVASMTIMTYYAILSVLVTMLLLNNFSAFAIIAGNVSGLDIKHNNNIIHLTLIWFYIL